MILHRLKRRLSAEDGWVLVIALALMTIMIGLGLTVLKLVDEQQTQGRFERVRESSFNMTEGVLYAEGITLQNNWPTKPPGGTCSVAAPGANCAYGQVTTASTGASASSSSPCKYASATLTGSTNQCPTLAEITKTFNNVDDATGAVWDVQVRDNIPALGSGCNTTVTAIAACASSVYDATNVGKLACKNSAGTAVQCTWDANGDRKLWVRATGIVRGKTRKMVALLQLERVRVPFPENAVTANSLVVSNNGQAIVDATGSQVVLRCANSYDATLDTDQVKTSPAGAVTVAVHFAQGNLSNVTVNDVVTIDTGTRWEQLKVTAKTAGTGTAGSLTFANPGFTQPHAAGTHLELAPTGSQGSNKLACEGFGIGQLSPQQNVIPGQTTYQNALNSAVLDQIANDPTTRHLADCSTLNTANANWSGNIVIDNAGSADPTVGSAACTLSPSHSNTTVVNGPLSNGQCQGYGFLFIKAGTLSVQGNITYCGVIYLANSPAVSGYPALFVDGNSQIRGAAAVDNGGAYLGSGGGVHSGGTVVYDANAFQDIGISGSTGLIQNTWRELTATQ